MIPAVSAQVPVDAYQRHHWEPAMATTDVNGVAGNSWATNKSPSARSTAVAFYPRVTRGVIYISVGKAVVEEHRLVNELYLDWISSCINRGKINNMVGGSVTQTQLPSR